MTWSLFKVTPAAWPLALTFLIACFWMAGILHRYCHGRVSRRGLQYRRYFLLRSLSWEDVTVVRWATGQIEIVPKGRKPWQAVAFLLNIPASWVISTWLRRADKMPEEIAWIESNVTGVQVVGPAAGPETPPLWSARGIAEFLVGLALFLYLLLFRS
jgi:hypothetical protein